LTSAARVHYFPQNSSAQTSGGVIALKDEVFHRGSSVLNDRVQPSGHVFRVPTRMEAGGAAVFQRFQRLGSSPALSGEVSSPSPDSHAGKSELEALEPNWDDEGAPTPSADAVSKAVDIVTWAERNGLLVESVDPDVLGGVAIYMKSAAPRQRAWVSILNNGRRSIVIDADGSIKGRQLDDEGLQWLSAQFVKSDAAVG
jgi:hypothetical protein